MTASAPTGLPVSASSRRISQVVTVAVTVAVVWYALEHFGARHGYFDLRIYRNAVLWWLDGNDLYSYVDEGGKYGFTYPPFAALVMVPMAFVPFAVAAALASVATAAAITLTTWWLVAPVAARHGWPRWYAVALAVPVVCTLEPIRETMGFGQVNLLLVALVFADIVALRRSWAWAGAGIGLATAVKLTPGLFVVYLVLTGRWRQAGVAVVTFFAATAAAAAVAPDASWEFWTHTLWQTSRVGLLDFISNQSLLGMLSRLTDPAPPGRLLWLTLGAAVVGVALRRAVLAYRQGDELVGITLTGLGACLLSPISWTHHLYWIVPAAVVLLDVAAGRRLHGGAPVWLRVRPRVVARASAVAATIVVLVFALAVIWPFNDRPGHHHDDGVLGLIGGNAYGLIMLALVVALPIRTAPGSSDPAPPPAEAVSAEPHGRL
jgi:alpha-1,2-mannosyltransferase